MALTVYQAPHEFAHELRRELTHFSLPIVRECGSLFVVEAPARELTWAEWTWENADIVPAPSIGAATKALKAKSRLWQPVSMAEHRRTQLIAESIGTVKEKLISFGEVPAWPRFGAFSLLSREELLLSTECSPSAPLGRYNFVETNEPPSRAYLKLWEALTRAEKFPKLGDKCLDLGSSPGGWTWVLAKLGAEVLSVDRAALAPALSKFKTITWEKGDAFQYGPKRVGKLDWLVSDVICYPEKLFEFVSEWVESGQCQNFICTIKFQGEADPAWPERFRGLGGRVIHLSHNKHEVTWIKIS